jgi:hypothetical protein
MVMPESVVAMPMTVMPMVPMPMAMVPMPMVTVMPMVPMIRPGVAADASEDGRGGNQASQ